MKHNIPIRYLLYVYVISQLGSAQSKKFPPARNRNAFGNYQTKHLGSSFMLVQSIITGTHKIRSLCFLKG
jgi:hypothetical protein